MRVKEYPQLDYAAVELEADEKIPVFDYKYLRVSVPSDFGRNLEFVQAGFALIDRTVGVKVPVAKSKIDFQKCCRLPVMRTDDHKEMLREIAKKNFLEDHRFQVTFAEQRQQLGERIIDAWIDDLGDIFQCLYKEQIAGFASVPKMDEYDGMPFVYMAAVDSKYRMAGAAMSLYAAVFEQYRQENIPSVYGRISSRNMAVMNLYAYFDAQFSEPLDIYIKR